MATGRIITVRKTTMVRPAQETPRGRLWLSSLDLVTPRMHLPSVLFYRRGSADDEEEGSSLFFDGERMRRALAEALVPFYPLAGRFGRDGGDGRLEIDCNGEGVLFVEADAADTTLGDYGDFAPTAELRRLVPAVGEYTDDVSALPLLLLQVTHFKCGGVCLGVATDHYALDGMSALHFINSWAQLCRGTTQISSAPFIDRTLLRARDPPPAPSTFQHVEYLPPPAALPATTARLLLDDQPTPATAVDIFKLTRSDLARLRSEASSNSSQPRVSTYAVVAAHVWRCVTLARGLPPDQPTMLIAPVDGRTRLQHPPLPNGFLGNVVFNAAPVAEAGVVTRGPAVAAHVIQSALERMDGDYCRSALDCLDRHPDLSGIARRWTDTLWYNLVVTSWVRLPSRDADFGWGPPVFMGPAGVAMEGLAWVLPSANGDGSLSVAICLRAEHMDKFGVLMYDAIEA